GGRAGQAAGGNSKRWGRASLAVKRQRIPLELQEAQVDGGDEDGADVAAVPGAVAGLRRLEVVEDGLLVLAPGEAVGLAGVGEDLGPALLAEVVHGLGEVVV